MSLLINGFLMTCCGGGARPAKPAIEENEPPIRVDEPEVPPAQEDPDYNKKGGPGAGGGYLAPPEDLVILSAAARPRRKE